MLISGGMSKPRKIEKGTTYLITRRCFQRRFLLRPSELINHIVLYCLAYAAQKAGMLVHAYCVMANHYHLVVTDVQGKLPSFMHSLNSLLAKSLNAHHGRWESFWAPGSYSAVRLVERNDLLAKVVYTLQNPVAAGLVESSKLWPGLISRPEDMLGKVLVVARPKHFFRADGEMPELLSLQLCPPPKVDAKRFVHDARALQVIAEKQHRAEAKARRRKFSGRSAILALRPSDAPKTRAARRQLSPRVACRDKWKRIEALQREGQFQERYRAAWLRYKGGDRKVAFPAGTYWMVIVAGQPSEAPPEAGA
jgi:putative transposase